MKEEVCFIEKISVNNGGLLRVKPRNMDFDMIYRSASGVRWDSSEKSLYFASPANQESDIIKNLNRIVTAVEEEYGIILCVNLNTCFENINDNIKNEILKLNK